MDSLRLFSTLIISLLAHLMFVLIYPTDRENPDYATAEAAIATINGLMPSLIQGIFPVYSYLKTAFL